MQYNSQCFKPSKIIVCPSYRQKYLQTVHFTIVKDGQHIHLDVIELSFNQVLLMCDLW